MNVQIGNLLVWIGDPYDSYFGTVGLIVKSTEKSINIKWEHKKSSINYTRNNKILKERYRIQRRTNELLHN